MAALVDFFEGLPEGFFGKSRQWRAFVNSKLVENVTGNRVEHAKILERGRYYLQKFGLQFSMGQDPIPEGCSLFSGLFGPCQHIDAGNWHALGTGDIAIFAVGAIGQRFVLRKGKQPETLVGWPNHARAKELWSNPGHGAMRHASGAGNTFVRIYAYLHMAAPVPKTFSAARRPASQPLAYATPSPLFSLVQSYPPSVRPAK